MAPLRSLKAFWTNEELNQVESALREHIKRGGTSEDVNGDEIAEIVSSRSKCVPWSPSCRRRIS